MTNRLTRAVRWSAGRPLPLLVLVFVVLLWLISFSSFAFSEASIARAYGTGTLDLQLGADAAQARDTLLRLGASGRQAYDGFQLVDLFFPASYALALSGLIWRTWQGERRAWVIWPAALPVLGAALDYLENALVRVALTTFPDVSDPVLTTSTTVTTVKLSLSYASQALVAIGLLVALTRLVTRMITRHRTAPRA